MNSTKTRPHGLEKPFGSFNLAKFLEVSGGLTVAAAVSAVVADWDRQAKQGRVSGKSMNKSVKYLGWFVTFANANNINQVHELDTEFCARWVHAKHGIGVNAGKRPTPNAAKTRRYVLRQFFTTARTLGLYNQNPADFIDLGEGLIVEARALTGPEARACLARARTKLEETRLPAVAALALAGATPSEIASLTVADLGPDAQTVWVHDGGRNRIDRTLHLDPRYAHAVRRRARKLGWAPSAPLVYNGAHTGYGGQSAISMTLRDILRLAGVAGPDVNPKSFTRYAATRTWWTTNDLVRVAAVTGVRTLDAAARYCGFDWQSAAFNTDNDNNGGK